MRVLVLHPEDSPRRGPWTGQRWDLIVDLGRSSEFSAAAWSELTGCPTLRSDSFRNGIDDLKLVKALLSAGMGQLLDEEGIDWWSLTALLIAPQVQTLLTLKTVAAQIGSNAEVWTTRAGWPTDAFALLLGREVQNFSGKMVSRLAQRLAHYAELSRRFTASQLKEIVLDKYDPAYRWRSRFAPDRQSVSEPVVLIPSAYGNVSRMASCYARLLPDQNFLLIATRESGKQCEPPPNVRLRNLSSYARTDPTQNESSLLLEEWRQLKTNLCALPEFEVLSRAGVLDEFPHWFCNGLRVRNAWREVLDRENVCSVLCGDDSNVYTRLPVLLAARRKIPTVDFHHGAMDGRYLLKDLPSDVYLAKNAMERDYLFRVCGLPSQRVIIGAPSRAHAGSQGNAKLSPASSVIFFSEPYENAGMRAEEVYREILPPLCRMARASNSNLVLKLHPFESLAERKKMVQSLLPDEDSRLISVLEGPLSEQLLSSAWAGLTVESTTVLDCLMYGVQCFLVGWLTLSPFEYVQQYARFGVGDVLQCVSEIAQIPARVATLSRPETKQSALWKMVDPEMLRRWLTAGSLDQAVARQVS